MDAVSFQLNKVRRLINTQGAQFSFQRQETNEFGEPNGQTESVDIVGVYHETTSFLSKTSTESTTIRQKPSPMILCLWEDAQKILHTDELSFNGKTYKVGEVKNISEANIVGDISLEEVQTNGQRVST